VGRITLNIAPAEKDRDRFKREMASVDWNRFVQSADYHYFVARILLSQQVHLYGLFCAHQCAENYLKAYLAFRTVPVGTIHVLLDLLSEMGHIELQTVKELHPEFYAIFKA